jgi:hypothetical protein
MEIPFEYGTIGTKIPSLSIVNSMQLWNFSNANNDIYNSRSILINEPGSYTLVFYYGTGGNGGKGDVSTVITNEKRDDGDVETVAVTALNQVDFYGVSSMAVQLYQNILITTRSSFAVRIVANGKQVLSTGYNILGSTFMLLKNV